MIFCWVCKMEYSLKIAGVSNLDFVRDIMYNEEIKEKEKYGFDFQRRFKIYSLLHFLRCLFRLFLKRENIILALKTDENIAGGLIVSINYNKKTASIGHVSIAKSHRGRGLGTFMIGETIKFLKEKNVKKVELSTDIRNEASKRMYLKNRFQVSGIIYQLQGKHFFEYGKNKLVKRILYKILLNEERISSEIEGIKIWWVKTNKGWYTFIQDRINKEKDIKQMIEKEKLNTPYIKKELVFSFCTNS